MWIVAGGQTVDCRDRPVVRIVSGARCQDKGGGWIDSANTTSQYHPHTTRHVSDVWQCLEWRVQYSEKVLNSFFAILSQKALVSAFSKHCTLHSAQFQTSLTCLPLKTGPLSCSAPGPGWVHIPATAGGGELVVARRAAGNRKISWNSNQCSNKCCLILPKLHHLT